jgi:hypothetical protein
MLTTLTTLTMRHGRAACAGRAAAVALALAPTAALAGPIGVNVGARAGYAVPIGDASKGEPLSDVVAGAIPLQVDATYAFASIVNAGVYASYGRGTKGDKAGSPQPTTGGGTATVDSVGTVAYGLQANVDLSVAWAGLFAGVESLKTASTASFSGATSNAAQTTTGWQAGVQGGVDWPLAPGFVVGPFASVAFTKYETVDTDVTGSTTFSQSSGIKDKTTHQWITIGLRGSLGL